MGEHLEDTRLAGVPFVAGDQFSVADITALVTIDFAAKAFAICPHPTLADASATQCVTC
jgi:glutathione S-transferase